MRLRLEAGADHADASAGAAAAIVSVPDGSGRGRAQPGDAIAVDESDQVGGVLVEEGDQIADAQAVREGPVDRLRAEQAAARAGRRA